MNNSAKVNVNTRFAQSVHADIQRSTFQRNSGKKTTFNAGDIVPVYLDEILPGDTFKMDMAFISRMTTPIYPTMDNVSLDFYAFFTPTRLLWSNWEKLNGENKTSAWVPSTPPALVPLYSVGTTSPVGSCSLMDYLDIPVGVDLNITKISCLPIRNYYLIYNEWFRDQNLQAPIFQSYDDIGTPPSNVNPRTGGILKANKKHDYFTSALPAPQKGESQLIPIELNELIPVIAKTTQIPQAMLNNNTYMRMQHANGGVPKTGVMTVSTVGDGSNSHAVFSSDTALPTGGTPELIQPANLWADGTGIQISGSTISDLRTAFQLQKLYEKDARGGTRYVEMLKSHFGVEAQDYRLQRPEFLGKMSSEIGIHQVPQTSSTDETSPQGNLSAFAYGSGRSSLFNKSFVEHGYIMILACARQDKIYQQGIDRMWFRRDRFDFYYPTLANISEQPIYNRELYAFGNQTGEVFGYQEAWADYRYKPSKVSGKMRTGVDASFDPYHYADYYASLPMLSAEWIADNSKTNVDRTLAVQSSLVDQIMVDIAFNCTATRAMPVYSVPGMVDHF